MMRSARPAVVLFSSIALALLLTGCPKRPVTSMAQAPPPARRPWPPPPAPAPPPPAPAPVAAPTPRPRLRRLPPPSRRHRPRPRRRPAPAPPPPKEYATNPALADIHFDFDKANIRPADAKILDASAAWLKSNPDQIVLIEGNCDERGTVEYNLALGERRAKSAMDYLVPSGIAAKSHHADLLWQGAPDLHREDRGVLREEPARSLPGEAPVGRVPQRLTPAAVATRPGRTP